MSFLDARMVTLHLIHGPADEKTVEIDLSALENQDTVVFLNNLYSVTWNPADMQWEGWYLGRLHEKP